MKIPLTEFEQIIDETILKRGLQYFKKGLVNEPEEIAPGEYEAIVEGTDEYLVELTINNHIITQHACSCPYDKGPVCKHVVAVIFSLLKSGLDMTRKAKKSVGDKRGDTSEKKSKKKKSLAGQIDEVLEKISHDDLKVYVKEVLTRDRSFRELFLANFAYLVIPDSKELYAKQIQSVLKSAEGRHGYIEYSDLSNVSGFVFGLVERAEQLVGTSNYQTAMYIACAVLENMSDALKYVDDSSGDFSGCVESSIEVLIDISEKSLPEELRIALFNYCVKCFKSDIFKGYDWHFSMLSIATSLVKTADEIKLTHQLIDSIKPSDDKWDWNYDQARKIKLELIRRTENEESAIRYMEQNISLGQFRKELIESAMSKKDYRKVISLSEEGIAQDEKDKPGLADDWRNYLIQVYIILDDIPNIVKLSHHMFLYSRRDLNRYFNLLKLYIKQEEWDGFVNQLVQSITKQNRFVDYSTIAQIYIWEEKWDRLFEIVRKNGSLQWIDTYEKYLIKDYINEISEMYQIALLKYMTNNMGRDHYQTLCRYLRKMIKLGARDKVNYIIQQLKSLYPKRKALMEELSKV